MRFIKNIQNIKSTSLPALVWAGSLLTTLGCVNSNTRYGIDNHQEIDQPSEQEVVNKDQEISTFMDKMGINSTDTGKSNPIAQFFFKIQRKPYQEVLIELHKQGQLTTVLDKFFKSYKEFVMVPNKSKNIPIHSCIGILSIRQQLKDYPQIRMTLFKSLVSCHDKETIEIKDQMGETPLQSIVRLLEIIVEDGTEKEIEKDKESEEAIKQTIQLLLDAGANPGSKIGSTEFQGEPHEYYGYNCLDVVLRCIRHLSKYPGQPIKLSLVNQIGEKLIKKLLASDAGLEVHEKFKKYLPKLVSSLSCKELKNKAMNALNIK